MLEQAVDSGVEYTPRMELVAHGDLPSCRHDGATLVVELVSGLQAAEISPGFVEAPGHPEEVDPVGTGLPRHDGVVQVPPEPRGGRQALYLEVGLVGERLG